MSNGAAHVTVMLDEEYGYREWIWRTGMTAEELTEFWRNIPTMEPYFFSPKGLPGKVLLLFPEDDQSDEDYERLRESYRKEAAGWVAHIHVEDDSYLQTPTGEEVLHAGYQRVSA